MTNATTGRQQLRQWEDSKPHNFFTADPNLQNTLRYYLGDTLNPDLERLTTAGAMTATVLDAAAKMEDEIGNHPRLQRWSAIGERVEQIEFHPQHDRIGQAIWRSGIMAMQATPGHTVLQMALFYLFNHLGEAGHMCSLACTSGLIRALQQVADDGVRDHFLPPLLNPDYTKMQHGAQFLTEIQGGSDVGSNAVTASPNGDGTWRINGEKWFCSNINADQFLMTARPHDTPDGTRGLGLFVVPRLLADGSTNGFYIRRLKDKLGTRTLASAEVDFVDALAYPVGPLDRGFKNVVELVLNTSRLMNAVACTGIMRRATIEAASYACHRTAFGQAIAAYPLVQEAVADLVSEVTAAVASSFYIAHLLDKIETGQASEGDSAVFRLLVNVNKYLTSVRGSEMVHRAIEVLGGNGAIESFSILPRLYRDMVVLESWEGTHNVLCLQVIRDIARFGLHEAYATAMNQQLDAIHSPTLQSAVSVARESLYSTLAMLGRMQQGGDNFAQAHARRLVDAIGVTTQTILLLAEAQWEIGHGLTTPKPDVITYFVNRHLRRDYDPLADDGYLARLERLMAAGS
ncbi:MAG: acyl-CoA dehydrogenase [Chloroflexota bacterium]|nr:MAG: acyl-CoA dehydrogenase [Chloroflexota bacterium]